MRSSSSLILASCVCAFSRSACEPWPTEYRSFGDTKQLFDQLPVALDDFDRPVDQREIEIRDLDVACHPADRLLIAERGDSASFAATRARRSRLPG